MNCPECDYDFPSHLISELTESKKGKLTYREMCPFCAQRIINEYHGWPAKTPFREPRAQKMLEEAQQLGKKGEERNEVHRVQP